MGTMLSLAAVAAAIGVPAVVYYEEMPPSDPLAGELRTYGFIPINPPSTLVEVGSLYYVSEDASDFREILPGGVRGGVAFGRSRPAGRPGRFCGGYAHARALTFTTSRSIRSGVPRVVDLEQSSERHSDQGERCHGKLTQAASAAYPHRREIQVRARRPFPQREHPEGPQHCTKKRLEARFIDRAVRPDGLARDQSCEHARYGRRPESEQGSQRSLEHPNVQSEHEPRRNGCPDEQSEHASHDHAKNHDSGLQTGRHTPIRQCQ